MSEVTSPLNNSSAETAGLEPQYTNPLTGLPNRKWLMEQLSSLSETQPGEFSLLFVDVDGLKDVNDRNGHAAGDQLLRDAGTQLAIDTNEVIASNLRKAENGRPADKVGFTTVHLSGDEFVVVLPGLKEAEHLELVKERLTEKLAEKNIKASMGGRAHRAGEGGTELLNDVDKLMYENKRIRKQEAIKQLPKHKRAAHRIARRLDRYVGIDFGR